jgi:hypothetical protein
MEEHLAPELVKILLESKQEIPDFLNKYKTMALASDLVKILTKSKQESPDYPQHHTSPSSLPLRTETTVPTIYLCLATSLSDKSDHCQRRSNDQWMHSHSQQDWLLRFMPSLATTTADQITNGGTGW